MNNPDERDREKKKCYDQFRERKGGKRRGKADRQEHGTNRAQIKGCIKLTMHIAHTHTHVYANSEAMNYNNSKNNGQQFDEYLKVHNNGRYTCSGV